MEKTTPKNIGCYYPCQKLPDTAPLPIFIAYR